MINFTAKQFAKIVILLLSLLLIQSCSSVGTPPKKEHRRISKKAKPKRRSSPKLQNFDKKAYPNEAVVIANMIEVVQPELTDKERDKIASHISLAIKKYNVQPQIIVAIIDTESDFKSDKVSSTGDISVAQINVDVWNKEFIRMKRRPIIKELMKTDQLYALMKMAEILYIIKTRYEKIDRRWYARYHSNTLKHKHGYLNKLELRLRMIANSNQLNTRIAEANYSQMRTW